MVVAVGMVESRLVVERIVAEETFPSSSLFMGVTTSGPKPLSIYNVEQYTVSHSSSSSLSELDTGTKVSFLEVEPFSFRIYSISKWYILENP